MARRSIIFLIALFVFLPIFAYCLPAKNASPSSHRFRLHPWWNLTFAQIKQYFAEGRAGKGKVPSIPNYPSPLGYVTPELWLLDAYLNSPPSVLRFNGAHLKGVKKGNKIYTDDEALRQYSYNLSSHSVIFDINLETSDSAFNLKKVCFLAENNLGNEYICQNLLPPKFPSLSNNISGAYYKVEVPLNSHKNRKLVSADAKWLRLWIIAKDQRLPVTFWLDNSEKVQFGKSIKSK